MQERLNLILKDKNMKKADLARLLDFSAGSISAYLNGVENPGRKFMTLLNEKLKININWLLTGEGEMLLNRAECEYEKELRENSEKLKMTPEQLDLILKAAGKEPEFMSYAAKAVSGDETAKERLKKLL